MVQAPKDKISAKMFEKGIILKVLLKHKSLKTVLNAQMFLKNDKMAEGVKVRLKVSMVQDSIGNFLGKWIKFIYLHFIHFFSQGYP